MSLTSLSSLVQYLGKGTYFRREHLKGAYLFRSKSRSPKMFYLVCLWNDSQILDYAGNASLEQKL
jgi:hypothetical protein